MMLSAGMPDLYSVAQVTLGLLLFTYIVDVVLTAIRRRKLAQQKGCKAGKKFKQWDVFFGFHFLYQLVKDWKAHKFLEAWEQRVEANGRTFWLWLFGSRMIFTTEPENVKAILATSSDDWERGYSQRAAFAMIADGIFAADGEHWQRSRALLRPSFARSEMNDTDRYERHFQDLLRVLPTDGKLVDLAPLLGRMTMDTATDLMFGTSTASLTSQSDEDASKFYHACKYTLSAVFRNVTLGFPGRMLPDRTYSKARRYLHRTVNKYVQIALERKQHEGRRNDLDNGNEKTPYVFLDHLAERTKNPKVLLGQSFTALLGGTETTATLLSNLLYVLARRPEIWEKLRVEALSFGNGPLNADTMKDAVFLSYCIKESLRLHSIVPVTTRLCNKDTVLPLGGGSDERSPLLARRGTYIYMAIWPMHRRKDIYGEDADEFRPERWASLRPGWGFIPFGGGARICVGQQLALTEATYTMLRLLQLYERIEAEDDRPWVESIAVTASSATGCKVYLHPTSSIEAKGES